jgi:hypothetical protein
MRPHNQPLRISLRQAQWYYVREMTECVQGDPDGVAESSRACVSRRITYDEGGKDLFRVEGKSARDGDGGRDKEGG